MLDTAGDLISALVEGVSRGIDALLRLIFRWETAPERPAWVRIVAIALILFVTTAIVTVFFAFITMAVYVMAAAAAIAALVAFLGLS